MILITITSDIIIAVGTRGESINQITWSLIDIIDFVNERLHYNVKIEFVLMRCRAGHTDSDCRAHIITPLPWRLIFQFYLTLFISIS